MGSYSCSRNREVQLPALSFYFLSCLLFLSVVYVRTRWCTLLLSGKLCILRWWRLWRNSSCSHTSRSSFCSSYGRSFCICVGACVFLLERTVLNKKRARRLQPRTASSRIQEHTRNRHTAVALQERQQQQQQQYPQQRRRAKSAKLTQAHIH